MPSLYIIGGPNGAGKTTVALSLLPNLLGIFEYVNADAIAAGLSPLNPKSMAIQAGRLMLARIKQLQHRVQTLPLKPPWLLVHSSRS